MVSINLSVEVVWPRNMSNMNISTSRRRNRSGRGQTANNNNNNNQRVRGRRLRPRRPRARRAQLRRVELIPSAVINRSVTLAPRVSSLGGNVVIKHNEYFATLSADTSEAFASYLINPCNALLFPWLAMLAPSWERYRFRALSIRYKTNCSTTFAGDLALAIEYDARDALPTSFGEFSSHEGCVSGNYYGNLDCLSIIKNFDKQNRGWYLTAESEKTTELATFYAGKFETYTSAVAVAGAVGKMYVDYVVELNNPQPRDLNGFTSMSLPTDLTMNTAKSLLSDYITQGGTTDTVGNDVDVTTAGLRFLKGGDYIVNFAVDTVTDAAVLAGHLTSTNGTSTLLSTAHPSDEDRYVQAIQCTDVQPGDSFDWTVSAANLVSTAIHLYAARYFNSNYK